MPRTNRANPVSSFRRVAIDGHFLDEVRTRLYTTGNSKSISYASASVERHQASEDSEGITLTLPALTALQLYHDGVLSANPGKSVQLTIANRPLGAYYLQWMRGILENQIGSPVLLRFTRHRAMKEHKIEPNAWLKAIVPLKLYPQGEWDPAEEYWGEHGEPVEAWAKPIIKRGIRPMYEMEHVVPGADPENFDSDPIIEANDLIERGRVAAAKKALERLIIKDMRCNDAHAHLGTLAFDEEPRIAIDHYQRGTSIGELSVSEEFDGVLSWSMLNNRPFLRCLSGFGLCLWRLNRFEEAEAVFVRLLWMSPSDNLGMRFLLTPVRARKPWTPDGG